MSILGKLTEGIVRRDLSKDGEALLNKWEQTGLLEGLDDYNRNAVAVLLENQAKELLREATAMASGDVEGFAAVAFPIVRRVFGSLVAQELVSVQPMSLPSGLIFFLDFTAGAPDSLEATKLRDDLEKGAAEPSVYGGGVVAAGAAQGVDLATEEVGPSGMRNLRTGMSSARQALAWENAGAAAVDFVVPGDSADAGVGIDDAFKKAVRFDPDVLVAAETDKIQIVTFTPDAGPAANLADLHGDHPLTVAHASYAARLAVWNRMVKKNLSHVALQHTNGGAATGLTVIRRLSSLDEATGALTLVIQMASGAASAAANFNGYALSFAVSDNISASANTAGAVVGGTAWEMEGSAALPEINIKVDSLAVTAQTRKLKATWTPELAQDLNAYHNLDAEVELTGLLSEQIALEIDSEILGDLLKGATAGTLYWSRTPGHFVNRLTGVVHTGAALGDFTGTVSEWYETLIETINDISADIHRKTLRGGANFVVCGPEAANILEFTAGFRANVVADSDMGMVGAVKSGSLSKKFDVYVTHAFPRNVILVGRKGGSFLESGFVYAPYVPLQVTPTIFDPDTFVPRKAVMTRYGKKMVRPDMYGLVVIRDFE
jgi:hypothetical protein